MLGEATRHSSKGWNVRWMEGLLIQLHFHDPSGYLCIRLGAEVPGQSVACVPLHPAQGSAETFNV